ncbi:nitroreductase family deazaflavin-dependent oxidoreductase [Rhodococcus koreensis]
MLPRQLAKFNRLITNRTYGRLAGHAPWMGIVVHRGRKSRREYHTPVNVHRFAEGYRISLDYGPDSDWVQNVVAQGGCSLVTRGRIVVLVAPQVIHDPKANWAPPAARRILAMVGSGYYLQLRYID